MAEGARLESVCTTKVVPRVRIPLSPPEVTKVIQKKLKGDENPEGRAVAKRRPLSMKCEIIPLSPPEVTKVIQKKLNLGRCPNKLLKSKYKSIFRVDSLEIRDWQNVVALFVK